MQSFTRIMCLTLSVLAILFAQPMTAPAQDGGSKYGSVSVNADLVSRYVWRGNDFGNSASIQPTLAYSISGFTAGLWGSYPLSYGSANYDEIDLYASYALATGAGTFKPMVTDYTFPYLDRNFFDFSDDSTGAHTVELGLGYTGPTAFPISLMFTVNVYNDGEHAPYFEVGYPATLDDVSLSFFAGGTKGECGWYGVTTDRIELINVGLGAIKTVAITDKFSLPMAATFVVNLYTKRSYLIFKISL